MRKLRIQLAITVALFLGIWFLFTQIDWVEHLQVKETADEMEQQLGDLVWEMLETQEQENHDTFVIQAIDSIVNRICTANEIDPSKYQLHVLNSSSINAFALPNNRFALYTGLVKQVDKPEELAGVIAHEIAHLELGHITQKLIREFGLTVLISVSTGKADSGVLRQILKVLTSSVFDRKTEREADLKAVDYLINAKISPEGLAHFLYKLSSKESKAMKYLEWISSHPNLKERANYIIEKHTENTVESESVLSERTWQELLQRLD